MSIARPRHIPAGTWDVLDERERMFALTPEATFERQVEQVARQYGWTVYHVVDSRYTPHGWPDIHCLRGRRQLVAELKRVGGALSEAQRQYLAEFAAAGVEVAAWTPLDWDDIHATLCGAQPDIRRGES